MKNKIKTHKGLAKRLKKTSTGKILFRHAFISHNLEKKSKRRKRRHAVPAGLVSGDNKRIKKLIPY